MLEDGMLSMPVITSPGIIHAVGLLNISAFCQLIVILNHQEYILYSRNTFSADSLSQTHYKHTENTASAAKHN